MFPYLIIVVILSQTQGQSNPSAISLALLALSIGTFLQALKKGPIGSGYLAPPVISAIYFPSSLIAVKLGGWSLLYGMTLCAGLIEGVFSLFLHRLRKFFPPVVSGLIIVAVGIQLGLLALSQILMIKQTTLILQRGEHLLAGCITLLVMIVFTVWARGMLRLLSPFVGIIIGFLFSWGTGIIPSAALMDISTASWISLPKLASFEYTKQ